ncbi:MULTISPECIES: acyltransferase [Acidobacteriaceae]|uniref:acyltransferase family protein n=1 Tax=Acidobacteriaceae TaxID=204434 RepID=UPI00131B56F8|nr:MULTISPECIES: acyltransferase [Acidobacteriaceae]MDW5267827.1 acyltransferase [Edaphobacter sp.]
MPERKPSRFYRPELDALRFFAFLCVFQHHVPFTLGLDRIFPARIQELKEAGAYGVCLFFLLSAYLITELLCKERDETNSVHLKAFYIRRVLRIWPLYFVFLGFGVVFGIVMPHFRVEHYRVLAFLLLAGNWYTSYFGFTLNPISPLWSISVEEQFYLLIPTIMKHGGRRAIWAVSALFFIVSYGVLAWLGQHDASVNIRVWTNSLVQFQFFAAGCMLAIGLRARVPKLRVYWRIACVGGGVALWMASTHVTRHIDVHPGAARLCVMYGMILAGTVLIFLGFLGLKASLIPKGLRYLGQISYGLYVFHEFIGDSISSAAKHWPHSGLRGSPFSGALDLALTIGVAALSYQFLERPFLRLKERYTFIKSRPA